ncbi:MAG TPA: Clp protease N-terminal domain-containing protein [Candidatus Elarobacter sp.]|jgi:ATP-dependent Clp protease ATP-binding subunit ClpC|nr:Clp protease N-terminal domain-containing protein [Candidatus Elarobacter sp.]
MWEPFTASARHTIVRAKEVAQLFGCTEVDTPHVAFALAEGDDDVGRVFAVALDRDAIRDRLGTAQGEPGSEMVFSADTKRIVASAFAEARKLNHNFIGSAHIALAVLDLDDPPPLAAGADAGALRAELARAAEAQA